VIVSGNRSPRTATESAPAANAAAPTTGAAAAASNSSSPATAPSAPAQANAAPNTNPSSPAAGSSAPSAPAPAYAQPASNSAAPTSAASTTAPRTLALPAGGGRASGRQTEERRQRPSNAIPEAIAMMGLVCSHSRVAGENRRSVAPQSSGRRRAGNRAKTSAARQL